MRPQTQQFRWSIAVAAACVALAGAAALLVEIFKVDVRDQSHLANASARGQIGVGPYALTEGFYIAGHSQTVVVRALGPSLRRFGLNGSNQDLVLRVIRNSDGKEVGMNRHWSTTGDSRLKGKLSRYAPPDPREAACVLDLPPGGYMASIDGGPSVNGLGMIEVYKVDR